MMTQRNGKLRLKNERFVWLLFQSFDFHHNKSAPWSLQMREERLKGRNMKWKKEKETLFRLGPPYVVRKWILYQYCTKAW
jgi:hypothetical protein